ncbi:MAG: cyclase family protein [bacterium]
MKAEFKIASRSYFIDLDKPLDISIPLIFNGAQPNTYDVPAATASAYEDDHFIGDTRRGGGCNFEEVKIIPHCNGTHTECVGHISFERISIHTILKASFIPSTLVTVQPSNAADTADIYIPEKSAADALLTAAALEPALHNVAREFLHGLIIRTLPNQVTKMSRNYTQAPPPYFSMQAMNYIRTLGVRHLLVDLPSVDRLFDEGELTAHHIFWDVPPASHEIDPANCSQNTITEMIYVPDEIEDGRYLLNLQIANFVADAAPSRPALYETL